MPEGDGQFDYSVVWSVSDNELEALRDRALSVALRFGLPLEEAEDVAQTALLKFLVSHEKIRHPKA